MKAAGFDFADLTDDPDSIRRYGQAVRRCGVTTVADLLPHLRGDEVDMLLQVTADPSFPARYAPIMSAMIDEPKADAARAVALRARSADKPRLGRAKLFTDGAISAPARP